MEDTRSEQNEKKGDEAWGRHEQGVGSNLDCMPPAKGNTVQDWIERNGKEQAKITSPEQALRQSHSTSALGHSPLLYGHRPQQHRKSERRESEEGTFFCVSVKSAATSARGTCAEYDTPCFDKPCLFFYTVVSTGI